MITSRSVCALVVAVVLLCSGAEAPASVLLQGTASGRLTKSDITISPVADSGPVALPDDGSTGVYERTNGHLHAAGIAGSNLTNNAIGSAAGSLGASIANPGDISASRYGMTASGDALFQDELTVTHPTLPIGTPVTVQFSYQVAFSIDAQSSLGFGAGDSDNRGLARANVSSNVSSVGLSIYDSFYMSSGDNAALINTDTGTTIYSGLFSGTQHVDMLLDTEVGAAIQFSMDTDADAIADVEPKYVSGSWVNHTASATALIGLAVGASPVVTEEETADGFELISTRYGGAFPPASAANAAAAAAAMPANPVPEPATVLLMALGAAAVMRRRQR